MTTMQSLPEPTKTFGQVSNFTSSLDVAALDPTITRTAALLVLDLIGVLAAGTMLKAGEIARNHAVRHWSAGAQAPVARLLFDGRPVSLPGFGFATATQIDNLDAHDGWQPSKGHAGAALFPALCAFAQDQQTISGHEALAAMIVGYEISYRAALALHETVTDYHTSGAWNALGCAAIGARLSKLSTAEYRNALGISEYHAPRSQMMREIATPSMLHDGTGWGAPTGIYAVLIAQDGFEGGPAALVEFDDAAFAWTDLGQNWLTTQQYIKPYPICRWSHAAIDAALKLKREHDLSPELIEQVNISTFTYSADLNGDVPTSTYMAQYSLAWPVAAALVRGHVGVNEILESSFNDPDLVDMTKRTSAEASATFDTTFPERRLASVSITLKDGQILDSGTVEASGGPTPQPTQDEVVEKFRAYAGTVMAPERVLAIERAALNLDQPDSNFHDLLSLLYEPVTA